ncbi:hypothetical protein EVAR_76880_1 [Eumeta japonica]|uniref:Uncharacterized protein n=1 Tax=Eumeta variegata TaxID=151549 RepID=A0A4C1SFC8_EUMVA|nr:hypothetical protein EVAR_76880_1 [Eumeta japonica]
MRQSFVLQRKKLCRCEVSDESVAMAVAVLGFDPDHAFDFNPGPTLGFDPCSALDSTPCPLSIYDLLRN